MGGTSGHQIINNTLTGATTGNNGLPAIMFGMNTKDILIEGNTINGWLQGLYINPSSNLEIKNNTFSNNYVGIGSDGLNNVNISKNTFTSNTFEAIGSSHVGTNVKVNENSFIGNEAGVNWYSGNNNIDATKNWWGHASGPKDKKLFLGTLTTTTHQDWRFSIQPC